MREEIWILLSEVEKLGNSNYTASTIPQLFIKPVSSHTYTINANPRDSITTIKSKIFDHDGTPPSLQRLISSSKPLNKASTVLDEGLVQGCTIHVALHRCVPHLPWPNGTLSIDEAAKTQRTFEVDHSRPRFRDRNYTPDDRRGTPHQSAEGMPPPAPLLAGIICAEIESLLAEGKRRLATTRTTALHRRLHGLVDLAPLNPRPPISY